MAEDNPNGAPSRRDTRRDTCAAQRRSHRRASMFSGLGVLSGRTLSNRSAEEKELPSLPLERASARHASPTPSAATRLRPIGLDSSPLHGELLGVERLEERARALAAGFTLARNPQRGPPDCCAGWPTTRACCVTPTARSPATCAAASAVAPAAEWLLDNFHLVEGEIREIRRHLPTRYYRELPKLATRELAGTARVYAMAVELLRYSDARLDAAAARPVHQRLPDRGAAQHRRAVGVAQHAQARPDRAPAPALRGADREPRGPPRGGPLLRRLRERAGARPPAAAAGGPPRRVRGPAAAAHARVRRGRRRAAEAARGAAGAPAAPRSRKPCAPSTSGRR